MVCRENVSGGGVGLVSGFLQARCAVRAYEEFLSAPGMAIEPCIAPWAVEAEEPASGRS